MSLLGGAAGAAGKKAAGSAAKAGAAKTGGSVLSKAGVGAKAKGARSGAAKAAASRQPGAPSTSGPALGPKPTSFGSQARQAATGQASEPEEGGAKAAAAELGKSVLKDAAIGAVQGAGGGLVGAGIGAAKGAATGVLKSKTGRKLLVTAVIVSVLASIAGPSLFILMSSQMIAVAASGFSATNEKTSIKTAVADGQKDEDVRAAMELVSGSAIPWQLAASVKSLTTKDLDITAFEKALDAHDPSGVHRDIIVGAVYNSDTDARKIDGDAAKAQAAVVQAVWAPAIHDVTGETDERSKTIYERAVAWTLAQSYPACGTAMDNSSGPVEGDIRLAAQQIENATTIMGVAKSIWADPAEQKKASIIGIATAMQESSLHNLSGGDRDSLGLFQQRPSMGWGSTDDIMKPAYSASAFFVGVASAHIKGLSSVVGWQTMPVTQAAQKVQRSGLPDAYAKWEALASGVVEKRFAAAFPVAVPASIGFAGGTGLAGPGAGAGNGASLCFTPALLTSPAQKPIYKFTVSDGFGPRGNIGLGTNPFHYAQDLSASCDTPIYAAVAGTVTGSGMQGSYGNRVKIDHGNGFSTLYAHMPDGGPLVHVGDTVAAGQQIGRVGKTGASSGCHLHFETWINGERKNPVPKMQELGVDILTPEADPHLTH